jgi:metallo-beta-lactamase family protein
MSKISFLGAAGNVTGSRFLLQTQEKKLLIDCGLFQGLKEYRLRNWEAFPVAPSTIDTVLLTHAHIDHSGYIPRLCRQGFGGSIHCTHATQDLCSIMLRDSAHLQEEDARWANKKGFSKHAPALPLYTTEDAEKALTHFTPHYYGEDIFLTDSLRIKFKNAGHILGSSFIDVKTTYQKKVRRIIFSGDLGRPSRPILWDPVQVYEVDYLVLESTYGNRLHGEQPSEQELARVINESMQRGGVLVIPSFAVGRTQELLFFIRELEEQKKIPSVPVYVDSPMAVNATEIFKKRVGDYDLDARILELNGKHIFETGKVQFLKDAEQSKALHNIQGRAIIISASGMAEGGRILHHLEHRLPHQNNTVLFIGFQAEGTRGRAIMEGKPLVKIHGLEIPVRARIETISGFSAHADYNETLAWLMGFNRPPIKTFIVHGEAEASASLAEKIKARLGWNVVIPKLGESFDLEG